MTTSEVIGSFIFLLSLISTIPTAVYWNSESEETQKIVSASITALLFLTSIFVLSGSEFFTTSKLNTKTIVLTENMPESNKMYKLSLDSNTITYSKLGELIRIKFNDSTIISYVASPNGNNSIKVKTLEERNLFGELVKENAKGTQYAVKSIVIYK